MFISRFASLVSIGAHHSLAGLADILFFPLEADNDEIEIGHGREAEPKHVPRTGGARLGSVVSSAKLDVEDMAITSMKTIEAEVSLEG